MIYIGVDPGLSGGIAALDKNGESLYVGAFKATDGEFDHHDFSELVGDLRIQNGISIKVLAGVEKVHSMPKQGVASSFKFGSCYGKILGVLAAKQIPYELITPQAWTKIMLAGESKDDKKDRGKMVAKRLFPGIDFRESERSRVAHSGKCDAILIAEYLRRLDLGRQSKFNSDAAL